MLKTLALTVAGLLVSASLVFAQSAPGPGGGPPGGGGGGGASASKNPSSAGSKWKITGESVMIGQAVSIGCWVGGAMIGTAVMQRNGRELTPIEVNTIGMYCGSIPSYIIGGITYASGIRDNACSYDVARRAYETSRSPDAYMTRDSRNAGFNSEYYDCYHGKKIAKRHVRQKRLHHGRRISHRVYRVQHRHPA